ncbi:carbonic anhydrase [Virgisporangium aurantiacum]
MFPLVPDPTAPPPVAVFPPAPLSPLLPVGATPSVGRGPVPDGSDAGLAALVAGNRRFASGRPQYGHQVVRAVAVATRPAPFAVVVGCMDTRVPVEAVFDQDFGSLFVVRTGGHVLDRAALGSIEIAVGSVGVPLVLVLGHRRCAAVAAAVDAWQTGRRPKGSVGYVVDDITDAIRDTDPERIPAVDPVSRRHTARTVDRLQTMLGGTAAVVGAYYDVDTGVVELT